MSKLKLHEFEPLPYSSTSFDRVVVPGGWLYRLWKRSSTSDNDTGYAALCFAPDPTAPHVRDRRRLRLREGYASTSNGNFCHWRTESTGGVVMSESSQRRGVTVWHADGSETDHATRLEAHDALVDSGSPSPFEVVTGAAVEPEHEPTPDAA
jgi:hypothetical protein